MYGCSQAKSSQVKRAHQVIHFHHHCDIHFLLLKLSSSPLLFFFRAHLVCANEYRGPWNPLFIVCKRNRKRGRERESERKMKMKMLSDYGLHCMECRYFVCQTKSASMTLLFIILNEQTSKWLQTKASKQLIV